jgi:hypothetical protein
MKDKIVLFSLVIASICVIIGFIGKLTHTRIYFQNFTWHTFAQTALLFAIAWGIGKLLSVNKQ